MNQACYEAYIGFVGLCRVHIGAIQALGFLGIRGPFCAHEKKYSILYRGL